MLAGGCPWPGTLHDSYRGAPSQAAAAAAFLRAHPGQVDLISIDIGSNDLLALVGRCRSEPDPTACISAGVPATLATLASNYGTLLARSPRWHRAPGSSCSTTTTRWPSRCQPVTL